LTVITQSDKLITSGKELQLYHLKQEKVPKVKSYKLVIAPFLNSKKQVKGMFYVKSINYS